MKNVIKILITTFMLLFCPILFADTETTTVVTKTSKNTTTVNDMDTNIISAIYKKYAKDSALIGTSLTVSSVNGIVTVEGEVTAQSQADEAVIAAKSIKGVKDVRSAITVTTNPPLNKAGKSANY